MKGEAGSLVMNIKGENSSKIATLVQNEMKKLGLFVQLREDAKVIQVNEDP